MLALISKKKNVFFLLISWVIFWISIGITPANINYSSKLIIEVLNVIRIYAPIFLTVIFTIFIIIAKLYKKKTSYNINYFSFTNLFLYYFLIQLIGLYNNELLNFNLQSLYLVILGLGSLEIFIIREIYDTKLELKYLLYISLFICLISSGFLFILLVIKSYNLIYVNLRELIDQNLERNYFFGNHFPRSTGISRSFGIINLFIILYFLFLNKKKIIKYFLYLASFFYTCLIWLLQSRGSLIATNITIFLIISFIKKRELKKKILIIFFVIFFPVITLKIINAGNNYLINKGFFNMKNYINTTEHRLFSDNTSSGRINIWKESFKNYDYKKIFGYGPQGDRFLLKNLDTLSDYSDNASNALIYSFLSGGYFAFIIFLIIYLKILVRIFIYAKEFIIKNKESNINLKLSVSYVIFFTLRSFFENSFAVFGIDFLLFISSALYIENYQKRISKYF
jgi:O-antigen ligase